MTVVVTIVVTVVVVRIMMGVMPIIVVIVTTLVTLPSEMEVDAEAVPTIVPITAGNPVVRAAKTATEAPATLLFSYSASFITADSIRRPRSADTNRTAPGSQSYSAANSVLHGQPISGPRLCVHVVRYVRAAATTLRIRHHAEPLT